MRPALADASPDRPVIFITGRAKKAAIRGEGVVAIGFSTKGFRRNQWKVMVMLDRLVLAGRHVSVALLIVSVVGSPPPASRSLRRALRLIPQPDALVDAA